MPKFSFHRQPITLDESVMFGYLVHKYAEAAKAQKLKSDGSFYLSLAERFHTAPLDLDLQDLAIEGLQKRGYIKIKHKKASRKRYYRLFVDKLLRDVNFQ